MVEHKERPILFSGPMVRAILAGKKTQTRRLAKTAGRMPDPPVDPYKGWARAKPGDRLWVRETFTPAYFGDGRPAYRADWTWNATDLVKEPKWRPSIFMHRHESRLTLEITGVRMVRLQDITTSDIIAEGVTVGVAVSMLGKRAPKGIAWPVEPWTLRDAWRVGWSAINGVESWTANPWVIALAFRRQIETPRG